MRAADVVRLLLLGMIWGASFIFMRVAAPSLGPVLTADIRVAVASLILLVVVAAGRVRVDARRLWRRYLIVGALNSAVPFALFCWAETRLPASTAAILNATSPLFGMIVAAVWVGEALTARKMLGMGLAFAGVLGVLGIGSLHVERSGMGPVLACLAAALSYGVAATYAKVHRSDVPSFAIAFGSQAAATILLLPLVPFVRSDGPVTAQALAAVAALGVLCTGFAYMLYFRLIEDIGPSRALTVTFLTPGFGLIWSALFLHESITIQKVVACGVVLLGTALANDLVRWPAVRHWGRSE